MSNDHAEDFDTYHSLHPQANVVHNTDIGGDMRTQYEDERTRMDESNLARSQAYLQDAGFQNMLNQYTTLFDGDVERYAPTTQELQFDPSLSYDQWLFEILRRDPEWASEYWDAQNNRWHAPTNEANLIPKNNVYSGLTRDDDTWLPGQIYNLFYGMAHPGTDFATAQQLTDYVFDYDTPSRRRVWEYQRNEARYMNQYIDRSLQHLRDVLPEGDKMSVAIFMAMVEIGKGVAVGSQKLYSTRVFNYLRNVRELTRAAEAVQNGDLELQDLQDAVDMLQRPENAFNNIRLVENDQQIINNVNRGIREIIPEFPPRDAATNPDWQEFLRDTNRTDMIFEPQGDPADMEAFDMTVEEANEYSANLQEWIRFQQKNIYRDIIRENPNISFEDANILQTGRHTAREETWADEWELAQDEYVMNELDRLLAERPQSGIDLSEEKVEEAGGEPPVWELEAPPPELERPQGGIVDDLAQAELENVLAGEVLAGMSAVVPISQMRLDENEVRERKRLAEATRTAEFGRLNVLGQAYNNNEVFVRIGGGWYRGVASGTGLFWHDRDQAYTDVTLTDLDNRVISVPIEPEYIRLASEFQPDYISTSEPYGGQQPDDEDENLERFVTDMAQFETLDNVINQNVFIQLADGWHRGTINDFQLVPIQDGANPIYGVAVRVPFKTVGGRQDSVIKYIPLNANILQFDTGNWSPDEINFWEPGTDPTEVFDTDNMHIEDHRGEQIYSEGVWRTLQTVRPAPGYPNNKTLVFTDGSTYVLKGRATVPVRLYGEISETERPQPAVEDDDDEKDEPETTPLTKDEYYDPIIQPQQPHTTPITKDQGFQRYEYEDDQEVMSYLMREHNEVYTIWKNPDYQGTDGNRVERIFGGVVPFMSYNSEGHPILMNDQELNHHGHSEFNMVHVSRIETQEQSSGQVTNDNPAVIQQTNEDNP